jgi:hypothetical protein
VRERSLSKTGALLEVQSEDGNASGSPKVPSTAAASHNSSQSLLVADLPQHYMIHSIN